MKLTPKELETVELLRNISHENQERIHNILKALMTIAIMNYTEGEPVVIPLFGSFLVRYKGDTLTNEGREAEVEVFFDPSPAFKQNIGAYEDFKSNKIKDLSLIPIIRELEIEQTQSLKMTLNDTLEPVTDD